MKTVIINGTGIRTRKRLGRFEYSLKDFWLNNKFLSIHLSMITDISWFWFALSAFIAKQKVASFFHVKSLIMRMIQLIDKFFSKLKVARLGRRGNGNGREILNTRPHCSKGIRKKYGFSYSFAVRLLYHSVELQNLLRPVCWDENAVTGQVLLQIVNGRVGGGSGRRVRRYQRQFGRVEVGRIRTA